MQSTRSETMESCVLDGPLHAGGSASRLEPGIPAPELSTGRARLDRAINCTESGVAVGTHPRHLRPDDLITHPELEKAYKRWLDGAFLRQARRAARSSMAASCSRSTEGGSALSDGSADPIVKIFRAAKLSWCCDPIHIPAWRGIIEVPFINPFVSLSPARA